MTGMAAVIPDNRRLEDRDQIRSDTREYGLEAGGTGVALMLLMLWCGWTVLRPARRPRGVSPIGR